MSLKTLWLRVKGDNKGLKSSMKDSEKSVNKFGKTIKRLGGMIAAAFAIRKIVQWGKAAVNAYRLQKEAEVKLATVMKQRMGLGKEALEDLKKLASTYQRIGVIGDEVQLAGLQQLATFVHQKESLEAMLPAMNNLLAQQKGYNAEAVDAVNIANMMGRALTGQLGSLSRVGITFTEAQGEALKLGNETERAAAMAEILNANVGNVNEELAKTDLGKIKSFQNMWGDMKETLGQAIVPMLAQITEWIKTQIPKMKKGIIDIVSLFDKDLADSMKSKEELQKEANKEVERMNQILGFIEKKQEDINRRKKWGLEATRSQTNYIGRQLEFYKKHEARLEAILALIELIDKKGSGAGIGAGVSAPARPSVPGTIGGKGGINTGAQGIDTGYLREMGHASGLEWTDAFNTAAEESFARWEALDTLKAALQEAASMIVDSVGMIFESIGAGEFDKLGDDLLGRFADFLSQLGKLMVAYGTAMLMFSILSKSPDPISAGLAIGAGLTAIAVAGLIRGAVSGAADGLSGGGNYGSSYGGATSGGGMQPLANSIEVQGVLRGSDIVISSRRYTNGRNSVT